MGTDCSWRRGASIQPIFRSEYLPVPVPNIWKLLYRDFPTNSTDQYRYLRHVISFLVPRGTGLKCTAVELNFTHPSHAGTIRYCSIIQSQYIRVGRRAKGAASSQEAPTEKCCPKRKEGTWGTYDIWRLRRLICVQKSSEYDHAMGVWSMGM